MTTLLDQPVPEINVPILSQTPATANQGTLGRVTERLADETRRRLREFTDWLLSYVPPTIRRNINQRVEDLKTE